MVYDGASLAEDVVQELPASMVMKRLYENYTKYPGSEPESLAAVQQEINRGYGIVHHVGHGYVNNMSVGIDGHSLVYGDADGAANGDRTFILYAINCASAAVDYACIDEHFLRNPHGGAVAAVGATRSLYPGTNHFYDLKFYQLVFGDLPEAGDDSDRLGKGTAVAKAAYSSLAAYDNSHRWTQFTLDLPGRSGAPDLDRFPRVARGLPSRGNRRRRAHGHREGANRRRAGARGAGHAVQGRGDLRHRDHRRRGGGPARHAPPNRGKSGSHRHRPEPASRSGGHPGGRRRRTAARPDRDDRGRSGVGRRKRRRIPRGGGIGPSRPHSPEPGYGGAHRHRGVRAAGGRTGELRSALRGPRRPGPRRLRRVRASR